MRLLPVESSSGSVVYTSGGSGPVGDSGAWTGTDSTERDLKVKILGYTRKNKNSIKLIWVSLTFKF